MRILGALKMGLEKVIIRKYQSKDLEEVLELVGEYYNELAEKDKYKKMK